MYNQHKLPIELIYKISNFLDPFDIINLAYVYKLNLKNNDLNTQIKHFAENNYELVEILFIHQVGFIDYKIISILRDVIYLYKKLHKYNLSKSLIYIRQGNPYITRYGNQIIYQDFGIINIYYPKVLILQKYISTF